MRRNINSVLSDQELVSTIDDAICNFSGDSSVLENAIGALMVGRHIGWKPLLLTHDRKTIKKYERALKMDFREVMPEVGVYADRSYAWKAVQKLGSFWKAVKGEAGAGIRTNRIAATK